MKKFLLSLAFIGAASSLTTADSFAEQCKANDDLCLDFINVLAESIKVSSCTKNAGVIQVTVTNKRDATPISITVTGPNNYNKIVPLFQLDSLETRSFEFTGLINGSYTVVVNVPVLQCLFRCTGIVVNNRKLNCLPLLCCCK